MKRSLMNEYMRNRSSGQPEDQSQPPRRKAGITSVRIFAIVAALFAFLLIYAVYQLRQTDIALETKLEQVNKQLTLIGQRLDDSDSRVAELTAQLRVSTERLGLTQSELDRTQQMAARLKQEQQQRVRELTQQLERKAEAEQLAALQQQTTSRLGALSADVSTTRQEVATVGKDVAETRGEVSELKLKLSEYGTLIARNSEELAYLRRRGERDYFEFDIRKGGYQPVSDLRLKLNKTDVKKQRYDLEFIADDRNVKKSKVNINEPIQVFVGGLRTPYEIVVNRVQDNRIIGYVSAPKDRGRAPGSPIK